jgi:hypothetical protein
VAAKFAMRIAWGMCRGSGHSWRSDCCPRREDFFDESRPRFQR